MVAKLRRALAVAALGVAALVVSAVAPAGAQTRPETINVVATGESFQPIGFGEDRGPRVGEGFVLSGSLYEWAGRKRGKRIGRFELHVVATSDRGGYESGSRSSPPGRSSSRGFTPFADVPVERQAVIGGTGRYVGARGSITVRGLPDGESSAVTVRLLG